MAHMTATESARPIRLPAGMPVVIAWTAVVGLLTVLLLVGHRPNGDADDLLKAVELKHFLLTGNPFDRTIPGILQPAPFASHWPWLVDLPYVAVAWLLTPLAGADTALDIAMAVVPPALLLPALYCLYKIGEALGFDRPVAVFALSVFVSSRTLAEFQPYRIDYHNLQMLMLLAAVCLALRDSRRNALLSGALTALALAVGLELALFFALFLAIRAFDFIAGTSDAAHRLALFGGALAVSALILFFAITPPGAYWLPMYDRYSSPHAFALIAAGVTFVIAPLFGGRPVRPLRRLVLVACGAAVSLAALVALFPQAFASPYAGLSPYLRDNWFATISQEMNMVQRPDFILSNMMGYTTLVFVGALALVSAAVTSKGRIRRLTIAALFSLMALAHALFYFRYFRFLPIFAGSGLAMAVAAVAPPRWRRWLAGAAERTRFPAWSLWAPGLLLAGGLVAFHLAAGKSEPKRSAADMAAACPLGKVGTYDWPVGSRILAPPLIGIYLLGQSGAIVTTIPFHPAAESIERTHRFFDQDTADRRAFAEAAQATHVAVCGWRGPPLAELQREYPFTADLIEGRPPPWLRECPTELTAVLRIYTFGNACPTRALD